MYYIKGRQLPEQSHSQELLSLPLLQLPADSCQSPSPVPRMATSITPPHSTLSPSEWKDLRQRPYTRLVQHRAWRAASIVFLSQMQPSGPMFDKPALYPLKPSAGEQVCRLDVARLGECDQGPNKARLQHWPRSLWCFPQQPFQSQLRSSRPGGTKARPVGDMGGLSGRLEGQCGALPTTLAVGALCGTSKRGLTALPHSS